MVVVFLIQYSCVPIFLNKNQNNPCNKTTSLGESSQSKSPNFNSSRILLVFNGVNLFLQQQFIKFRDLILKNGI